MSLEGYIFKIDKFQNDYPEIFNNFYTFITVGSHPAVDSSGYIQCYEDDNDMKINVNQDQDQDQETDVILNLFNNDCEHSREIHAQDCDHIVKKLKKDSRYTFVKICDTINDTDKGQAIYFNLTGKEKFLDYKINDPIVFDVYKFIIDNFDSDYNSEISIDVNTTRILPINCKNIVFCRSDTHYDADISIHLHYFPEDGSEIDAIVRKAKYITYFRNLKATLERIGTLLSYSEGMNYLDTPGYMEELIEISFNL
jgi:hypothetical protein